MANCTPTHTRIPLLHVYVGTNISAYLLFFFKEKQTIWSICNMRRTTYKHMYIFYLSTWWSTPTHTNTPINIAWYFTYRDYRPGRHIDVLSVLLCSTQYLVVYCCCYCSYYCCCFNKSKENTTIKKSRQKIKKQSSIPIPVKGA